MDLSASHTLGSCLWVAWHRQFLFSFFSQTFSLLCNKRTHCSFRHKRWRDTALSSDLRSTMKMQRWIPRINWWKLSSDVRCLSLSRSSQEWSKSSRRSTCSFPLLGALSGEAEKNSHTDINFRWFLLTGDQTLWRKGELTFYSVSSSTKCMNLLWTRWDGQVCGLFTLWHPWILRQGCQMMKSFWTNQFSAFGMMICWLISGRLSVLLWAARCLNCPHPRTRSIIAINKIRSRSIIANLVHPGVQATFYISFPHAPC